MGHTTKPRIQSECHGRQILIDSAEVGYLSFSEETVEMAAVYGDKRIEKIKQEKKMLTLSRLKRRIADVTRKHGGKYYSSCRRRESKSDVVQNVAKHDPIFQVRFFLK